MIETKKQQFEKRITELQKMIKQIKGGALSGDVKEIRKLINKYKEYIKTHKELDNEPADVL